MLGIIPSDSRFFVWKDNPMIKKNITSLLVILIFINSIGCYNFTGKTVLFGILGITGIIVIISIIAYSDWAESTYGLNK